MKIKKIYPMILSIATLMTSHAYATLEGDLMSRFNRLCDQTPASNLYARTLFDSIVDINGCEVHVGISRVLNSSTNKRFGLFINADKPEALSKFIGIDEKSINKAFLDGKDEQNSMWCDYMIATAIRKLESHSVRRS